MSSKWEIKLSHWHGSTKILDKTKRKRVTLHLNDLLMGELYVIAPLFCSDNFWIFWGHPNFWGLRNQFLRAKKSLDLLMGELYVIAPLFCSDNFWIFWGHPNFWGLRNQLLRAKKSLDLLMGELYVIAPLFCSGNFWIFWGLRNQVWILLFWIKITIFYPQY